VGGSIGGGDFYTLAMRAPGHIGVIIGDTSGRGAEGEAHLCRILPSIHDLALSRLQPSEVLSELNRCVAAQLPSDRFVTAAAFELDLGSGVLTVSNAAHVPAIVKRARDRHVYVVGHASGVPLGIAEDTRYSDQRYQLNHGDMIVLMSDGVLEAVESDLMSMSTLKRFLSEASDDASEVHGYFLHKFEECTTGIRTDDMTLMVLGAKHDPISAGLLDFSRTG
jgi:sigma-B regulation protein RsbU (phosphoserine phosphatase)